MSNGNYSWIDDEEFRLVGTGTLNGPAFRKEKRTDGSIGERILVELRICKSCGNVIHSSAEAGGVCNVCSRLLCAECAKHRCALCGACVCSRESRQFKEGDVCQSHTFWQIIRFLW